jgi:hypothetical protein
MKQANEMVRFTFGARHPGCCFQGGCGGINRGGKVGRETELVVKRKERV